MDEAALRVQRRLANLADTAPGEALAAAAAASLSAAEAAGWAQPAAQHPPARAEEREPDEPEIAPARSRACALL